MIHKEKSIFIIINQIQHTGSLLDMKLYCGIFFFFFLTFTILNVILTYS
jgi:hypothetical protein